MLKLGDLVIGNMYEVVDGPFNSKKECYQTIAFIYHNAEGVTEYYDESSNKRFIIQRVND